LWKRVVNCFSTAPSFPAVFIAEAKGRRGLFLSPPAVMAHPTEQGLKPQILIAALIAVLVFLQYLLWLAEDGVRQTLALRITVEAQIEENAAMDERNRALEADVVDLKNGLMAIEERARTEMGMIRPDETFYRILEEPLPKPVESRSAKPVASSRKPPVRSR